MLGSIYVIDFGEFIKIGKSECFDDRLKSLESEYKLKHLRFWVSEKLKSFDFAERFAHDSLNKHLISNERYMVGFWHAVDQCLIACVRANGIINGGVVNEVPIKIDPLTGYIDAAPLLRKTNPKFSISQFLKSEGVKYLNEEIELNLGKKSYFCTRGRNGGSFVHPFIFIEMNRASGVKYKVSIYNWMLYEMPKIEVIKTLVFGKNIIKEK
jgi:hypothetical protein